MAVTRKSIEFAKKIFADRVGDVYVYGGTWDPFNLKAGCDCSGLVTDILSATFDGTAMPWDREGLSTESYRYKPFGEQQIGPFTLTHVASPDQIPDDAVMRIDIHHEGQGGPDSHMHCVLDGWVMESNGTSGTCTMPQATDPNSSYWNDWWYVPGPLVEDGTPRTVLAGCPNFDQKDAIVADTLYADVSEFQAAVDDEYPYQVICIRSNDGTYQDKDFVQNLAWCKSAVASGKLTFFIVYFVWRQDWQDDVNTLKAEVGDPHPQMAIMMDVESWSGQITGDQSGGINAAHDQIAQWLGNPLRVVGYGNVSDLNTLWPSKPAGIRLIVASYGSNPDYPGKIAHQYTDGSGYGDGLPEGAPPFGNCDMDSADGVDPVAFAAALGIAPATQAPAPPAPPPAPTPAPPAAPAAPQKPADPTVQTGEIYDQLRLKWEQLGWRDIVEALAALLDKELGTSNAGKTGARFDG